MTWKHISPGQLAWRSTAPGVQKIALLNHPLPVSAVRLSPAASSDLTGFALVQTGSASLADGTRVARGDLVWRRNPVKVSAGDSGCAWSHLDLPPDLQPGDISLHITADSRPWQAFVDPAGLCRYFSKADCRPCERGLYPAIGPGNTGMTTTRCISSWRGTCDSVPKGGTRRAISAW